MVDENNRPLADAKVTLKATTTSTTTGSDGSFSLAALSGTQLVIVAARR